MLIIIISHKNRRQNTNVCVSSIVTRKGKNKKSKR